MPPHLHVSMKRDNRKALQCRSLSAELKTEEVFLNWNRSLHIFVPALLLALCSLAAALPLTAQAPSTAMPTVESTRSPAGDTTALAKEAEGWLADLIRIDTTNPPGNEQATAK